MIDRHADRRVLLITNDLASGLPWEMLASDRTTPAIDAGLVRRIAVSGTRRSAQRAQAQPFVRALLIVDPTGNLPGAVAEGEAVVEALRGRPDVELTVLRGAEADRARVVAELASGHYDVLHYAGHASFDVREPGHSGLRLADGRFVAADLAAAAPRLVVLSACESARVRVDDEADAPPATGTIDQALAEALLRAGVSTLVGTFFLVDDGAACAFSRALHVALAAGKPIGGAVCAGRRELHGRRLADWGNFVLYGDDGLIL
jgi:CHAT domain-containing protein